MNYKRLIPCIFIYQGKAVKWFDNLEILSDDVVKLAKKYNDMGADELLCLICLPQMRNMIMQLIL